MISVRDEASKTLKTSPSLQVLNFEEHRHGRRQPQRAPNRPSNQALDAFAVGQAEHLVVVQHCVHVLDPDGINRTIEEHLGMETQQLN